MKKELKEKLDHAVQWEEDKNTGRNEGLKGREEKENSMMLHVIVWLSLVSQCCAHARAGQKALCHPNPFCSHLCCTLKAKLRHVPMCFSSYTDSLQRDWPHVYTMSRLVFTVTLQVGLSYLLQRVSFINISIFHGEILNEISLSNVLSVNV